MTDPQRFAEQAKLKWENNIKKMNAEKERKEKEVVQKKLDAKRDAAKKKREEAEKNRREAEEAAERQRLAELEEIRKIEEEEEAENAEFQRLENDPHDMTSPGLTDFMAIEQELKTAEKEAEMPESSREPELYEEDPLLQSCATQLTEFVANEPGIDTQ